MNKSNLLVILGNIFSTMHDEYLKYLLVNLFYAIKDNKVDKLDIEYLKLFDYDIIKDEYYNIKNSLELFVEYYNINKYNDIINVIRTNNGLGYDREFLNLLYSSLTDLYNYDKLNNRLQGLFNLLNDNNLIYNNIGLRILIIKYLLNIDIKDLKYYQVDNTRLNDKYKFLVFKNDKIKNYSKLYFIDNDIILSTLQHDTISNVVLSLNDNINYIYGGNIEFNDNKDSNLNLNDYKYTFKDNDITKSIQYLYYLIDKYTLLEQGIPYYKVNQYTIDYDSIIVNDNNLSYYINYFNKKYRFIQRYDKLNSIFDRIEQYFINLDEFNSNDLSSDTIKRLDNLDYYKYDIDLKDYFLNP